jgi:hypothetical protein
MIIVAAVKCLCIIFYSGNIPNYDNVATVKCLCILFYSGNIPNYIIIWYITSIKYNT